MESDLTSSTGKRSTTKTAHILVIEDDPVTRRNIAKVLCDEGYRVTITADGQEAMIQVLTNPPDLILTNIQMPRLDGMDVLSRVRQVAPHIPVLLVSALVTSQTKRRARRLGATDFIEKPFDFDDLLDRIADALAP